MKPYRYPGPQPFSAAQQPIFFGRGKELDELLRLVRREQWLVLFGKSGLGKSSLLNAGLAPRLAEDDGMSPVFIRFHAWTPGKTDTPLEIAGDSLLEVKSRRAKNWFDKLAGDDNSLWRILKERQLAGGASQTTLLIFDQFEELFTFPDAAIEVFAKSLAEVFYTDIPDRYRTAIENAPKELGDEQLRLLHEPLPLRVVTAIRTDRMALMHQLKPFLPATLDVCYELRPLTQAAAEEAVLNPAYDPGEFRTPRFDYGDDALDAMLSFLSTGRKQDIESFQLQILCEYLEKNVVERGNRPRVEAADLADPAGILENYYLSKIGEIADPAQRLAARQLIEEGLIFAEEERRLTLFEGQIEKTWGVGTALLARLEDTHLLRREPSLRGGYTYELSHDTLVAPVLKAKEKRKAAERLTETEAGEARKAAELRGLREQAEAEKRRAEEAELLKIEAVGGRKRARMFSYVAGIVAAVAIAAFVLAFIKQMEANLATVEAKNMEAFATLNKDMANQNYKESMANLKKAEAEEAKALENLRLVNAQKNATEAEKKRAEDALRLAQENKAEVERVAKGAVAILFGQFNENVLHLKYDAAKLNLLDAGSLEVSVDTVLKMAMELAFFNTESGNYSDGYEATEKLLDYFNKPINLPAWPQKDSLLVRNALRTALRSLDADHFDFLKRRYFPFMVAVKGGSFLMGRDTLKEPLNGEESDELPRHRVELSDFKMAETETTMWQYALFCAANGRDISKYHYESWDVFGNTPVIQVSWDDAVEYADWVGRQFGLSNAYRLPTEAEWEYTARGGPVQADFIYAGSDSLDFVAQNTNCRRTKPARQLAPVRKDLPIFDLSGNVWEWCSDRYGRTYYELSPETPPRGPAEGASCVRRGGSWSSDDLSCRVSNRNDDEPRYRSSNIGFRVAQDQ